MRGLIVDFVGVLDGPEDEQRRWKDLFAAAKANGVATAILSNNPGGPAAEEIREWMSGNLCRCSCYPNIVDAVADAAKAVRR